MSIATLVKEKFGIDDGWPVMTESFKQWVIEDHFVQGRPKWEQVGAQMTSDVLPYEKMKLRLLNASHQALCYIGMLLGYQLVHETMEDSDIRKLVEKMMDEEVTPILSAVPGVDLREYKKTLIERFANPAIRDQLSRIGIYGSSGIPKFVLPSIEEQLKRGGPIKLLSFTVASWFRYLNGLDESGKEMPMLDPMAPKLRERAKAAGKDARQLLGMREVFSEELASAPAFSKQVSDTLNSFYERVPGRRWSKVLAKLSTRYNCRASAGLLNCRGGCINRLSTGPFYKGLYNKFERLARESHGMMLSLLE